MMQSGVSMRFRILLSLVVAAVGLGSAAPAAEAGAASNIPGIPLPTGVVTGRLGGPIVDVVYQVDVVPQRVLVVSLTGSAGTDFDIYLFDSSATNVYANPLVGLVAKSTGPTSTESIRYSTVTGGRFYIDLSSSDVEGDYRLVVGFGADTTPPKVSLTLDGGAPATNNLDLSVSVVASDDLSGVANMQFSEDGTTWSGWQPWEPITDRTLIDRDGRQDLWVRVSDRQGNISSAAKASIVLDRVSPSVEARYPDPGGIVAAPRPTIWVRFTEPIRPSSWQASGLIVQDPSGTVIYGSYGWDAATNTGSFTPSSDLLAGATYVASLGSLTDLAGNLLAPIGSWTVRPLDAPRITLTASPRVAAPRSMVELAGSTDLPFFGSFSLQMRLSDGSWEDIEPVLPGPDGKFFSHQIVHDNTTFRIAYSGDAQSAASTSTPLRVIVRRQVLLSGPPASVVRTAPVGARVSITTLLDPAEPSSAVTAILYRFDAGRHVYQPIATLTRTSSTGRAILAWRGSSVGTYAIRLTTPATTAFAAGVSPLYRWFVR